MAMVVAEFRARHPTLASVQDEIVGTDVAALSIDAARRARFVAPGGLRGLAQQHLQQFFHQVPAGFELDQRVRSRTRFLVHNLLDRPEALGTFDVIFLRNVLIYMNEDVQRVVLERVLSALAPGGYLLLGAVGYRRPRRLPGGKLGGACRVPVAALAARSAVACRLPPPSRRRSIKNFYKTIFYEIYAGWHGVRIRATNCPWNCFR